MKGWEEEVAKEKEKEDEKEKKYKLIAKVRSCTTADALEKNKAENQRKSLLFETSKKLDLEKQHFMKDNKLKIKMQQLIGTASNPTKKLTLGNVFAIHKKTERQTLERCNISKHYSECSSLAVDKDG